MEKLVISKKKLESTVSDLKRLKEFYAESEWGTEKYLTWLCNHADRVIKGVRKAHPESKVWIYACEFAGKEVEFRYGSLMQEKVRFEPKNA